MNNFTIICLHILDECPEEFHKVLNRNEYYFFNNWYELKDGKVVPRENAGFERNFFGENISIQAIVGKNGSGKSSILDMLYRLINNLSYVTVESKYRAAAPRLYYIRGIYAEFFFELNGKIGSVTCKGDSVTFTHGLFDIEYRFSPEPENDDEAVNHIDNKTNKYSREVDVNDRVQDIFESFFYSLAINYSMQSLNPQDYWNEESCGEDKDDVPNNSWLDSIYDKNDGYLVPFGIEPYKGRNVIDLAVQKELSDSRVSVLLIDARNRSIAEKKNIEFIPGYELDDIVFCLRNTRPDKNDDEAMAEYDFLNKVISEPSSIRFSLFADGYGIPIPVVAPSTKELFRELMVYIINKTFSIIDNYPIFEHYTGVREVFFNEEIGMDESLGEYDSFLSSAIEEIDNDKSHISFKIKQAVNLAKAIQLHENVSHYLNEDFSYSEYIKHFYKVGNEGYGSPVEILEHYPPSIFTPEIYLKKTGCQDDNSILYTSLSSGERQFATVSATYLYHIRNIMSVPINDVLRIPYRNINLFLDEIELCFHPEYQRQFVANVIKSLVDNGATKDCHINIILTTHSPLVLSDIPKSNILFLRDGSIANNEITYNTFGANVNDLLHKSFFLDKGFSGSFAQGKINGLAKLLTSGNTNKILDDSVTKTIDIVGDPLIKHQLNMLYDEYLNKFGGERKNKRIKELKDELRYLEGQ